MSTIAVGDSVKFNPDDRYGQEWARLLDGSGKEKVGTTGVFTVAAAQVIHGVPYVQITYRGELVIIPPDVRPSWIRADGLRKWDAPAAA